MWFKQIQLFQLVDSTYYSSMNLGEALTKFSFQACLPSMPYSAGWISPVQEENMPLIQVMNGYLMICLQIEEKILPAVVIRQELIKQIKIIEELENRKMGQKEKYALKDDIVATLLPRAFSKLSQVYAYLDTHNHWLILGTANAKKTEQFITAFKKIVGDAIYYYPAKNLSSTMTSWLKYQNHSSSFSIEKACVLQDENHESRIIRCQQQDLFASSIQSLIKDGCEVKQLALTWQDRVNFVLFNNLALQSIRYQDGIIAEANEMEPETTLQQFNADFLIMSETLNGLLNDLLVSLAEQPLSLEKAAMSM